MAAININKNYALILLALTLLQACCKEKDIVHSTELEPKSYQQNEVYVVPADTQTTLTLTLSLACTQGQTVDVTTNAGWLLDNGVPKRNVQVYIDKTKKDGNKVSLTLRAPASAEEGILTVKSIDLNRSFNLKFTALSPVAPTPPPFPHLYEIQLAPDHTSVPLNSPITVNLRLLRDTALALPQSPGQVIVYSMEPYSGPGNASDPDAEYSFSSSSLDYFSGNGTVSSDGTYYYIDKTIVINNTNNKPGRIIFRASGLTPYSFYKEVLLEWY